MQTFFIHHCWKFMKRNYCVNDNSFYIGTNDNQTIILSFFLPIDKASPHIITHWIVEYAWYAIKKASIHISCIHKNVEHVVTRFNDNVMFPPFNTHLKARSLSVTTTTIAENAKQMSEWGRGKKCFPYAFVVCLFVSRLYTKNTFNVATPNYTTSRGCWTYKKSAGRDTIYGVYATHASSITDV